MDEFTDDPRIALGQRVTDTGGQGSVVIFWPVKKANDQARSGQVSGEVRPWPRVLIPLDFQAKVRPGHAARWPTRDRPRRVRPVSIIGKFTLRFRYTLSYTVYFSKNDILQNFRDSSRRNLWCKVTAYLGVVGDFYRFFEFSPKIHPGAWATAGHGQASLAMIRPAI